MSRELIGGRDGELSTLVVEPIYVSCIDKPPTLAQHQQRRDEKDELHEARLNTLRVEMVVRSANDAVETLQRYAAVVEPYGTRTKPPSWFRRKYIRWSYKLKEIIKIIREH